MSSIDPLVVSPVKILFLGATGYIGGSILSRLIKHPARASHSIICYLRNQDKAKILTERLGIKTIIGTLDDSEKIEDAAAEADIVIHTAESADHLGSVQAVLKGLKRKYNKSGKLPIYFHTVSDLDII
jgi:nucleoside-diphosphate-sugar epimerase